MKFKHGKRFLAYVRPIYHSSCITRSPAACLVCRPSPVSAASPFCISGSPAPSVQPLDHIPLSPNNEESDNDDFGILPNTFSDSDSDHYPFSDDNNNDDFGIPLNQPPPNPW